MRQAGGLWLAFRKYLDLGSLFSSSHAGFLFARANGSATDGTACIISKKEQTVVPCSPPRLWLCTNTVLISFTVINFNGRCGETVRFCACSSRCKFKARCRKYTSANEDVCGAGSVELLTFKPDFFLLVIIQIIRQPWVQKKKLQ